MKKYLLIFILLISNVSFSQQIEKTEHKNLKIGLSLSGGGAKGFAHVGVLKVIDSLGLKIDYVAGTSMGSIVGGLYAAGYSGKEIEKIIRKTDFIDIISNVKNRKETSFFNKTTDKYLITLPVKKGKINVLPTAISTGQKNIYVLKELFKNVSNITDFSKLPIPFLCIATNLESGKKEIFEKGDLVKSIMASSAFPSLIDPVKIGDSLYIDGAMTVNFPSKPLKDKGMDLIIGVDLSKGLAKRKDLNSIVDILNQVIDFQIQKETKFQHKFTDILLKPDLSGFNTTSYDDKDKILNAGYEEALKFMPILRLLTKRDISLNQGKKDKILDNPFEIGELLVENSNIFKPNYILGKMNLRLPSMQTYSSINQMIDKLYSTNNYRLINYEIIDQQNKNILKLNVEEEDTRFFLKFGLHYDEIFKTGLLLNATAKRLLFQNTNLAFDFILGDKPRYYFNYFIDNGYIPGFGIYSSGMSFDIKNKNGNLTDSQKWYRNEAYLQSVYRDRYAIGGGLSHDYFENKDITTNNVTSFRSLNPYVFIKSDTQDDKNFASKGLYLNAEGKVLNFFNHNENTGNTFQIKADLRFNIPLSKNITNKLSLFGGFTFGDILDPMYRFSLGGVFEQNLNNFVKFYGYNFGQVFSRNILTFSNSLQLKFYKNFYLIPSINIGNTFENLEDEDFVNFKYGSVGLSAAYNSPFGQIRLNASRAFGPGMSILFNVVLGQWF